MEDPAVASEEKQYWENFYSKKVAPETPSPFAKTCVEDYFFPASSPQNRLLELGCGNGRDSRFFARKGYKVTSVDLVCSPAVRESQDITFVQSSMAELDGKVDLPFNLIYSRFSLHSVNEKTARKTLEWCAKALDKDGRLLIEARSVKDDLFCKGTAGGKDEKRTDHYRRFIRREELLETMKSLGFEIVYVAEEKGFAPYKTEDPVCVRVLACLA